MAKVRAAAEPVPGKKQTWTGRHRMALGVSPWFEPCSSESLAGAQPEPAHGTTCSAPPELNIFVRSILGFCCLRCGATLPRDGKALRLTAMTKIRQIWKPTIVNCPGGAMEAKIHLSLDRVLSRFGLASRNEARRLIRAGRIRVNGAVSRDHDRWVRLDRDRIHLDGRRLQSARRIYLLLYKPKGLITSHGDPAGRKTVYSCLDEKLGWIAPVGRLDKNTSGVLLCTNDNDFANYRPKHTAKRQRLKRSILGGNTMPYENDFYRIGNVVGYTGNLIKREGSLYFEDRLQNKYGRITFGHADAGNNGRGVVDTTTNYKRKNMFLDEALFADDNIPMSNTVSAERSPWHQQGGFKTKVQVEYVDNQPVHVSRGQFIKISSTAMKYNKALVEYIIGHYQDKKQNNRG